MVHNETIGAERRAGIGSSRAAIAGLAGIIGGLALIPISMTSDTTFGPEGSIGYVLSGLVISALFFLFATAVAGAYVRFGDEVGTVRKAVFGLYAFTLTLLGVGMVTYTFGIELPFFGDLLWIGGMFVLGSLFGVALWGTSARRRTAALFAAIFPVVLGGIIVIETVYPALEELAVVGLVFGLPLGLAFISLGLDLRSTETDAVTIDGVSTA